MEKKRLRRQISQEIRERSSAELSKLSNDTCSRILSHPKVVDAATVVAFWPLPDEVDIRPAVRELYRQGKTVFLPRVVSDTEMVLCLYEGDNSLTEGAYGIMEPTVDNEQLAINNYDCLCSSKDVVALVPGRAFDSQGHRLGRGKGYYDRFLAECPDVHTIGVCFPFQVIDNVPNNSHDIAIKEVIWKISK